MILTKKVLLYKIFVTLKFFDHASISWEVKIDPRLCNCLIRIPFTKCHAFKIEKLMHLNISCSILVIV